MPKRPKDSESKPLPSATLDQGEGSQADRFKRLATDEGLDTPEAHERFKKSLFTIAKGKPKAT